MAKSYAASKSDLDVLRKFAKWSNSFQVFEDERYEVGFVPNNSLNHLMIVEGYLTGKAPPPGHYSTSALKEQGKYVVEEKPFFDQPFIIDPHIDVAELTRFDLPAKYWEPPENYEAMGQASITGQLAGSLFDLYRVKFSFYIVPLDNNVTSYINPQGFEVPYREKIRFEGTDTFEIMDDPVIVNPINRTHTILPVATENVGKSFRIQSSFVNVMPLVDYRATVLENHLIVFESIEHGFVIYMRGWVDEDHIIMKPYRFQEEGWISGGTKHLQKQSKEVYGLTELIKIK